MVFNIDEVELIPKNYLFSCFSWTRGKNHKDWLYCGFGNSYSKSCYFIISNHITLKTYWDDTIDCNEQRWNKITSKKGVFVSDHRENHKDWLYCGFGNSYSKSCNFFDGYQMTLITFFRWHHWWYLTLMK